MKSIRRPLLIAGLVILVVAAATYLGGKGTSGSKAAATGPVAAVPVTTEFVAIRDEPVRLYAIGNVEPYKTVAIKARVDGEIVAVDFREGAVVHQGEVLFEIDRRPFEAQIRQAEATVLKDRALLEHANQQEVRYKSLMKKGFISPDGYEQMRTAAETADATVRADEAGLDALKLQLAYCTIRAPITGYAGKIMIQQGNLVKANDSNPLVVINQIVPVYVSFSIPEQRLPDVRKRQASGELAVTAAVVNANQPPANGKLSFIDNATDITTGTIKLKAEFANAERALWPGQFVNVVLTLTRQTGAVVIPATALQSGPNGSYVFVVGRDRAAQLRSVAVARTEGDDAVIASGLLPGEEVVTSGQLRLAPGLKVVVDRRSSA